MTIEFIDSKVKTPSHPAKSKERLRAWFNSYKTVGPTDGVMLGRFPCLLKHLNAKPPSDSRAVIDVIETVVTQVDEDSYKIRFLHGSDVLHVDRILQEDEQTIEADVLSRTLLMEQRLKETSDRHDVMDMSPMLL